MKIAILTSEYVSEAMNWHGGLANYLGRIAHGLKARGHEVHVFTYSDRQEIAEKEGIIVHCVTANDFLLRVMNILSFGIFHDILQMLFIAHYIKRYFVKFAKAEKFDIIHSSSCQTPGLFFNARKIGIPIVTRLSSITRLCQIAAGRRNKLDMYLMNLAEKRLAQKNGFVFAPSIITKRNAVREFGLTIDLIESPEYFSDDKETEPDCSVYDRYYKNKRYILFYGTLSRLKGSELIADIIHTFLDSHPDYYFAFVGKTIPLPDKISPLEPILRNAGEHRDRIIYTNSLRHHQLFPIIKNASAVFLPSMLDNFPNTLIESMSLAKIVIGTFDGGFDQLIEDGKNGFLIHYGDKIRALEILDTICGQDKGRSREMEISAMQTVQARLNFEKKIIELENYYKQAMRQFSENLSK